MESNNSNKKTKVENIVTAINAFVIVTSASVEDALTFLPEHEFKLGPAVDAYYEHRRREAEAKAAMPELPPFPGESPYPVPAAATSSREDKNKKKEAAGRSSGRGGIGTLADLSRQSGPGSDSDYYTGRKKR